MLQIKKKREIINTASNPLEDEVENRVRDLTLGVCSSPEGTPGTVCYTELFQE